MNTVKPTVIELIRDLKQVMNRIPAGFEEGSPLAKIFLMAYLAMKYNLRNYVQIGVDRGKIFLPMVHAIKLMGGMAYGIDAYEYKKDKAGGYLSQDKRMDFAPVDFLQEYKDVTNLRRELAFTNNSRIIKKESRVAIDYFRQKKITIDMLHIGGTHDTHILEDIEMYFPFVREGGFIVIDDINWDSVRPSYNKLKKVCNTVFANGMYAILSKGISEKMALLEKRRFNILHSMVENIEQKAETFLPAIATKKVTNLAANAKLPKISVIVISYNHEKYIAECLEGILSQKGDFEIELVIGDDYSTDGTEKVIQSYIDYIKNNERFDVKILSADRNYGMVLNLKRCLDACTGDYFAICEGDDYWIDNYKLQKQMYFLRSHQECALCFNDIYFLHQETGVIEEEKRLKVEIMTTREIVLDNSMGNFSRFFYDARYLHKIPDNLYNLEIADWMFNIYYSQFGDIGNINEVMSVYRIHKEGLWSRKSDSEKVNGLFAIIDEYNKFMNYEYDAEFSSYKGRLKTSPFFEEKVSAESCTQAEKRDQEQNEIMGGKAWKNSLLFHRIRIALAPPNSRRARGLRRLYNIFFVPCKNFILNRKTKGDLSLIRSSDLFNEAWYLANNPDVAQAKVDPALHYLRHGGFEGRDPSPNFYSNGYLDAYKDVKKAGLNPLVHYLKYGRKERRAHTRPQQIELIDSLHTCPVCQGKVNEFVPLSSYYEENWKKHGFSFSSDDFETLNSLQYQCPVCGATDRDRLYALYLTTMMNQNLSENPITILDIAPSYPLRLFLLKYPKIKYQSADKYMKDVDLAVDITNMNMIRQDTYDFFICSHVLEHVADDKKALSELYRILKPGGGGILMVPINLRINSIEEDTGIDDAGERWRRFGQDDHIRLYSKRGFAERVEEAGFILNQYGIDFFGEDAFFQYGISPKSVLYIVKKK